jgi:hypothetical protein
MAAEACFFVCAGFVTKEPILLSAADTSDIISSRDYKNFSSVSNLIFSHGFLLIIYFKFRWNHYNKFITKNSTHSTVHIGFRGGERERERLQNFLDYTFVNT